MIGRDVLGGSGRRRWQVAVAVASGKNNFSKITEVLGD